MVVIGTRPDAIKLAPVIAALRARPDSFETTICSTDQHREMLDQALAPFGIVPDMRLEAMQPEQSLTGLTTVLLTRLSSAIETTSPHRLIVQGDTTTAFAAALAGYYRKIPVAHVEAGLRSNELYSPFPEEVNRKLIAAIADVHFAPTDDAAEALAAEGIARSAIHVTGNTVVDALHQFSGLISGPAASRFISPRVLTLAEGHAPVIVVSCHRRESFGDDLASICRAIARLATDYPIHRIVFPVHLNPQVRAQVFPLLGDIANIALIEPVSYPDMLFLLSRAALVLSDSGGIQEEAPSFNVPLLILRRNTERGAGIAAGLSFLVGTDEDAIVRQATTLLSQPRKPEITANPFGDGHAGERIADILARLP